MDVRKLLIATVLLAILGAGVWWSNKQKAAEEAKPKPDTTPKVVSIPSDQVTQLAFKPKNGEQTVVKKTGENKWQMLQPTTYRVDNDTVSSVTSTLSSLTADELVAEKPVDLKPFGLAEPSFELAVTKKDGKTDQILIGDDTPTGGNVYVKLASSPRVYSMSSSLKSSLDKSAQDLRDKRLLTFDSDKLTRVQLTARKQSIEFGKNNQNEWQILQPKPLRADGWQVEELIRKLRDAKMDTSSSSEEDNKKAAAAFASATPVGTAKVTDNSGTQTLEVRKSKDDYYAKSSVVDGACKVTSELGQGLDKGLDDFRNKKVFDFGFSDPTKIDVRRDNTTKTYAKTGDKWYSGPKQIDSASLQSFIDKLRDLSATKFPETGGGTPVMDLTVTSNDGKRVEKVQITKQGNDYFAKRENEPAIYQLDQKPAEDLIKAAGEIKEAAPESKKK